MKQRQRTRKQQDINYFRLPSKDSDDSNEETELFIKKSQFQDIPTVEKVIVEGDTLQALSIRYHCPIAELKRLNNIHRENEIFAKNCIKVPARSFTIALATVHTSGSNSPKEKCGREEIDPETLKSKLNRELLNLPKTNDLLSSNTVQVNDVIFNSNVKPVNKTCDNINVSPSNDVHLYEEVRLLPQNVKSDEAVITKLSCSGADADISWIALIVCIVIVIVAVPLIYVLYIAEHPEEYHHSHS